MEIFSASMLRLVAYVATFGLIIAVIGSLLVAHGRSFDMRYYRLLCAFLGAYALWFLMLCLSIRDAELFKRGEMTWLFGSVAMGAAVGGWAWFGLTMLVSFQRTPRRNSGPLAMER